MLPKKIRIESSSICQLRCPSCPTTTGAIRGVIKPSHLRVRDYVRLLAENPSLTDIELSNYGEIFLNPELYEVIRYSFDKVNLHADNGVNFNHVTDRVLEALVAFDFKSMTVSIDGASNSTYSRYRVGGNFNTVIDNIRRLNALKVKCNSDNPKLTWQFVVFGHNEHEIETARKMAEELDMKFYTKLSWDEKISPIQNPELVQIQSGMTTVRRDEYEKVTGENYCRGICQQLWNAPVINSDGTMLGCCRNFWGTFGPNVFEVGLSDSLNNEKMDYAKQMLFGKVQARENIPCTTCDIYLSLVKSNNFLTEKEIIEEDKTLAEKETANG